MSLGLAQEKAKCTLKDALMEGKKIYYSIILPDSGLNIIIKSLTRGQLRVQEAITKDLLNGKLNVSDYQEKVLEMAYPDMKFDDEGGPTAADIAHLVRVTIDYSCGGPLSIQRWAQQE